MKALTTSLLHELADAKRIKRKTEHLFTKQGVYNFTRNTFIDGDGYILRIQYVVPRVKKSNRIHYFLMYN